MHSEALESITLPQIFSIPDVISLLPFNIQTKENNPNINFKLGKTTQKSMLNYEVHVKWISGIQSQF